MTGSLVLAEATKVGAGEAITFWVLTPFAVLGAIGMVWARNAVHSALFLVLTMLSLGVFYVLQAGPFLGMVQIIVYTGAIIMLFLFVLMLVGRAGPGAQLAADALLQPVRVPVEDVPAVEAGRGCAPHLRVLLGDHLLEHVREGDPEALHGVERAHAATSLRSASS